jgi:hypothetical protein
MVPETGIEPVRPLRKREILSLLCLPISPLGQCLSKMRFYASHLDDLAKASQILDIFLVYICARNFKQRLKPPTIEQPK